MFQSDLLAGKKILVTGGGTGLGKSFSLRYLELGAHVVICGRRQEVLDNTAKALRSAVPGASVDTFACDVRNADSVEAMMDAIWETGPLDVLVNNAAGNFVARTEQLSARAVDSVLNIVLHGSFYCTIAAGRRWIEGDRPGNVISTVTTPSFTGSAFTAPSAAAKAGVLAMTRSLAVEWGPKRIRLNCVAPGLFPTEGAWEQLYTPEEAAAQADTIPLRRVGEHIELANLYAYLASEGSQYMNGELLVMDGGRWMQGVGGPQFRAMQDWDEDKWNSMRGQGRKA